LIVRTAFFEMLFSVAVIVGESTELTWLVVIENVADVAPAKTVTEEGNVATVLLLFSATTVPPGAA